MPVFSFLTVVYLLAAAGWARYLYLYVFKKGEDRQRFAINLLRVLLYLPLGLQAVLLFCFAAGELLPVCDELSDTAARIFRLYSAPGFADFEPLKIVYAAAIVLALQYCLVKSTDFIESNTAVLIKLVSSFGSLFFLYVLAANICHALHMPVFEDKLVNYDNNTLWAVCSLFVLLVLCWLRLDSYTARTGSGKYIFLTAKILFLYSVVIVLLSLPMNLYFTLAKS